MSEPKTYFILRNTDYKPDGLIQIGQLIADPRTPYRRIAPPFKPLPAENLHLSCKKDWSLEKSKGKEGEFGVFAHFLTAITAETSAHASRDITQSWTAATLETAFLELGEDTDSPYVKASVKEAAVQKWLKREKFLKKVIYMVTGVKIAKKPGEASYGVSRTTGVAAKVGGDPGTAGAVSVGVQGGLDRSRSISESSTPTDDFVFAYRLRKIHISLRNKATLGKDVSGAELHNDGNVSGSDESEFEDEEPEEVVLDVDEIDDVRVESQDFGRSLPARDVKKEGVDEDDDSECLVVLTR
ncbi:hypothetical protein EsH8_I_000861 [Colletotrichum jinshuiense]